MIKPAVIAANRPALLPAPAPPPVFVAMGNLTPAQPTVNIPVPAIFSIVIWNVADFHESKAYANPFVNRVINEVLKAMQADLAIILEAQLAPSATVFAIANSIENSADYAWDIEDDDLETVAEYYKRVEADALGEGMYYAMGSETTGKRVALPDEVIAANFTKFFWEVHPGDPPTAYPWKTYYRSFTSLLGEVDDPLKKFYSAHAGAGPELTVPQLKALDAAQSQTVVFRRRAGIAPPTEAEFTELSRLLVELGIPKDNTPGAPRAQTDKESYVALFAWQRADNPNDDPVRLSTGAVKAQKKSVWVYGGKAGLVFKDINGVDAGFQQPGDDAANFRCPYLIPLYVRFLDGTEHSIPLLAFHGPFGGGTKVRAAGLQAILDVEVDPGRDVKNSPEVIVTGDFNLEFKNKGTSAEAKAFAAFAAASFREYNPDGKTSLQPLVNKHGALAAQLKSNYDHILVRGLSLQAAVRQYGVVDVIGHIEDCINAGLYPPLSADDAHETAGYSVSDIARYIYRKYVSDHLPVFIDFLVAGEPAAPVVPTPAPLPLPEPKIAMLCAEEAVQLKICYGIPPVIFNPAPPPVAPPAMPPPPGPPAPPPQSLIRALVVAVTLEGFYVASLFPDLQIHTVYVPFEACEDDYLLRPGYYVEFLIRLSPKRVPVRWNLIHKAKKYVLAEVVNLANIVILPAPAGSYQAGNDGSGKLEGLVCYSSPKKGCTYVHAQNHLFEVPAALSGVPLPRGSYVSMDVVIGAPVQTIGFEAIETPRPPKPGPVT
jgi:hypothetical protein